MLAVKAYWVYTRQSTISLIIILKKLNNVCVVNLSHNHNHIGDDMQSIGNIFLTRLEIVTHEAVKSFFRH